MDLPDDVGEALRWAREEDDSSASLVVAAETLPRPAPAMDQGNAG